MLRDLLDIDFEIKPNELEAYKDFILKDFEQKEQQDNKRFIIVEYPDCFQSMIRNALQTVSPFSMAKGKKTIKTTLMRVSKMHYYLSLSLAIVT